MYGLFTHLFFVFFLETGQKRENPSLEKKARVGAGVGDLKVVGERRVINLEANPSCSKDEPVASSVPIVGAHLAPQEACYGLFPQATFKPHVSKLRNSDPQLQEKLSESSTSTTNTSTAGQKPNVYLSNEFRPVRERAAETPPETLLQSCTSGPQKHPLPAKRTPSPVNVVNEHKPQLGSEFSVVNSAENLTPLALKDNDSEPAQVKPTVSMELVAELISKLKQRKLNMIQTPPMSALDYAESTSSSDNRRDLKPLNIESQNATDKTAFGSEYQLVKATAKKNSPSYSVVANKTTASFDVKKNLTTRVSSVSSANILFAQFVTANHPAKTRGDSVVFAPTAATAEATAPHTLHSFGARDVFRNVSSFSADCAANNQQTLWIPQSSPEPSGSSISTVISARPNPVRHTFQDSKNGQTHADVDRNNWATCQAGPTANLTDTAAVSGGFYAPHGQAVYRYLTGGDSGSFFIQSPTSCTTQNNPPIIAASPTQEYIYPNQMYPDQTGTPFRHNLSGQMLPGWECLGTQQQYAFWAREPGENQ